VIDTYADDKYGLNADSYSWEQNFSSGGWTTIAGTTGYSYTPPTNLAVGTWQFRRKSASCAVSGSPYTSGVNLKVVQPNGRAYGTIYGKSPSVTGIPGCTLTVQKTTALPGSPVTKTYTFVTGSDGNFDIQNIFYGDPSIGTEQATFTLLQAGEQMFLSPQAALLP